MSPLYEYCCDRCGSVMTAAMAASQVGVSRPQCSQCGSDMRRLYSPPNIIVFRSAADIMNRAAAGEGDPVPGMTREQTRRAALALSRSIKQGRSKRLKK